jgi:signal transduction histidine kinase
MNEGLEKEHGQRLAPVPGAGGEDLLERQQRAWQSQPFLTQVLDAVPERILVLNSSQQIVFANATLVSSVKVPDVGALGGRRWGDVLGCQYVVEDNSCGVAHCCRTCGGLKAIATGLQGVRDVQECRIMTPAGDAQELQVTAVPIEFGADRYVLCTFVDVSAQKRRRVLERLFFHDVLNTAIGVRGLADMLLETEGEQAAELRGMLDTTAAALVEQIQSQRLLTIAENKALAITQQPIDSLAFLRGILARWQEQGTARHLKLVVNADSVPVQFSSDETILTQVLNSMLRNAFDASLRGMEIALGCYAEEQAVVFRVRSSAVMTADVQLQVFQRSFSTRGSGRGLGTYSMRLLTEQCLGGKVGFSSGGSDGTTFYVRLPLSAPGAPTGADGKGLP